MFFFERSPSKKGGGGAQKKEGHAAPPFCGFLLLAAEQALELVHGAAQEIAGLVAQLVQVHLGLHPFDDGLHLLVGQVGAQQLFQGLHRVLFEVLAEVLVVLHFLHDLFDLLFDLHVLSSFLWVIVQTGLRIPNSARAVKGFSVRGAAVFVRGGGAKAAALA